ncbi:MAG TPA: DHHA1 domain-containing protein, partial [Beijerinckiaceae bacterium]|nr:DHHA1 domain-containing protein [Beijerinckiaceae bacterium]
TGDCGTSDSGVIASVRAQGVDVIVVDHHQAPDVLPTAQAVVNPNRQDDLSGLGHLCAAGVVFLTLVALNRELRVRGFWAGRGEPDLFESLDLVALATVADVVPLQGLNRAFVRQGLAVIRARGRIGLSAIFDAAGLAQTPECWHLGFLVGPRINAGGRIGDAALGSKLLLTADPVEAGRIAVELERLNRERQEIEKAAVEEACAEAEHFLAGDPEAPVIVATAPDWHPCVLGLVAARLKERFGRPAFALAVNGDGNLVGSARSVPGADLGRAVRAAVEAGIALKGGGHAMAAGVTIAPANLTRFGEFVSARLAASVAQAWVGDALLVDATLTAGGARPELFAAIERAGPFGAGQSEPVFAFPNHRVLDVREVGNGHVRMRLKSGDGAILNAVAFRAAGQPLGRAMLEALGRDLHAAGTLCLDRWGGGERMELRVQDVAPPA